MKWFSAQRRSIEHPLVLVLGLWLMAMAMSGCSNAYVQTSVADAQAARLNAMAPTLTLEDIVEEGVLTIGLSPSEGAPFVMESANGYEGIDVDVGAALASELGLQAKFVPINNDASAALTRVDVVMGVPTNASGDMVVASDYLETAAGFFTLGEEPFVASVDELQGQTLGLQEGSASQQLLNTSNLKMTETGFPNIDEAMTALTTGGVSYVLCPAYPGAYLAKEMGGVCFCGTLDVPVTKGVGVYSDAAEASNLVTQVQQAMNTIRDDGVLSVILAKWVGDLPRLTAETQVTGITFASDAGQSNQPQEGEEASQSQAQDGSTAGSNAVTADQMGGSEEGEATGEDTGEASPDENADANAGDTGGEGEEAPQTE